MIENMIETVIVYEFEKSAGKEQCRDIGRALHVGFGMHTEGDDQYNVAHMYIFAPMNYVFVAVQYERIDGDGDRHTGPLEILSYHDSCWRDAIHTFIFQNRSRISNFNSFTLRSWFDVIYLSQEEQDYLSYRETVRREQTIRREQKDSSPVTDKSNPFDKRGIWV